MAQGQGVSPVFGNSGGGGTAGVLTLALTEDVKLYALIQSRSIIYSEQQLVGLINNFSL